MKLGLFIACVAGALAAQTTLGVVTDAIIDENVEKPFALHKWLEKCTEMAVIDTFGVAPIVAAHDVYHHYSRH